MKTLLYIILFFYISLFANKVSAQDANQLPSILQNYPIVPPTPPGTLSTTVTVNGYDNFYLGVDFGEPYIATNPRNLINSICAFNINNYYYTLDGVNWTKTPVTFPGFGVLGDPVVCFDSLGNSFYMQLYQNGNVYGVCVAKSTNGGVTYLPAVNVYNTTVGLADKEWITADQTAGPYSNYLYAAWRQFGSSGMRFVRSTNGGATWSSPITLLGEQGAYVAVGSNGNIQGGSVYMANLSGSSIAFTRSSDGGATFSAQIAATTYSAPGISCAGRNTVKNCIRIDPFPRMAADNGYTTSRGNVYIAYCSNPTGPDLCDILLVRSTDFGQSWSAPIRVNDDNTTNDQFLPTVSVDNVTGKVYVSWFDSREDGANLLTKMYGTVSTDGGTTFTANQPISNSAFNPNNMVSGQPGGHNYIGDYIGVSAIRNTGYNVWMDSRNNNSGSYTSYYPDFAMLTSPSQRNLVNNDSFDVTVKIPSVKGPYTGRVKFTASLDTLPTNGTISLTFVNGRDSITAFPDSVYLRVKTIGNVTPRLYKLKIKGSGLSGVPVHDRMVDLFVNTASVTVGTNRNGICSFKVNGVTYVNNTTFTFPIATTITVQALGPFTIGGNRYVYVNWSDNGDTTHNVTINSNMNLIANYKHQFLFTLISAYGNTFGGGTFYDSAQSFTFGVLQRYASGYQFRGWTGAGNGSYTSPDSSGNDTAVTISMSNAIVETARWVPVIGIKNLSSEIPKEYKLYQNFPNPFNPVTNINFDIIKKDVVKIVIYDLLGREVEVVFNVVLSPGKYNLDYDASRLASGVYYYKITSGDFTDIKKMVLLK